ncbi:GNAT superfamily N-acetyltransferase [Agromyces flavus]|uniref:Acetyltransferase (GNAT) family protein n=1 Tax=Agromyces flavus TaxID=589382 RepID=A0A1H1VW63_9MICO|nr:GNAT family N-acetyltransferase [Agromyces flavus]MCP2366023.1 GNAT superfamily N-acetyltransferase [Agromyces flavus]GGI43845.1 N-acetyltransferase [Agromyces flavus]SDS88945.1 Acetyltransferase (GNAT) family protein [Agromyces flavus]
MTDGIRCSSDAAELDRAVVHEWLSQHAYWALDRPRQVQDAAIDASRNYGAYDTTTGAQLGYARVVTDGVTFAWLCDVIVDPGARGRGVGVELVGFVLADLEPLGLKRIALATGDAHGLYARYGFTPLPHPEQWMIREAVPPVNDSVVVGERTAT